MSDFHLGQSLPKIHAKPILQTIPASACAYGNKDCNAGLTRLPHHRKWLTILAQGDFSSA
ncbi:hypothetical protein [Brasilonema bromeliae]|nr:hypothetical protein [Brasilonema bromeliae]